MICKCGHSRSSHISKDLGGLQIRDQAIVNKYGGWCEVCSGMSTLSFTGTMWHEFKLDNLKYLELMYDKRK
jgi:hypothetical protein